MKASKGILFLMKDGKDPWENMKPSLHAKGMY